LDYGRCNNISFDTPNSEKKIVSTSTTSSDIEEECKNLSKSIIVYYPEWKYYNFPPKNIPFNKLTHINYGNKFEKIKRRKIKDFCYLYYYYF